MELDIFTKKDVLKIYICFKDGKSILRKELVYLRVFDNKNYYLEGRSIYSLTKPGWFAKAELIVYTTEGTYSAVEKLRGMDFSLEKIVYTVARPKEWKFIQSRVGERKKTDFPAKIIFSDDSIFQSNIINLSTSGFSILLKDDLTTVQSKFPCSVQCELFDNSNDIKAKYVRQQIILDDYELADYKIYSFKFLNLQMPQKQAITNYLNNQK